MRIIKAAIVVLGISLPAQANESLSVVVDLGDQAIQKGYGSMCDLEMKPARNGGYYPCLDFGPYRYVREYHKISGFVIEKGKKPFAIFNGTREKPSFIHDGPWSTDIASRMVMWWSDNVEKNSSTFENKSKEQADLEAASKYVTSLNKSSLPEEKAVVEKLAKVPAPSAEIITDDIRSILAQ